MNEQTRLRVILIGIVGLAALALWVDLPGHPDFKLGSLERDLNVRLGLDLQGGTQLIYRAEVSGIANADVPDAMAGVRDVVERRVNLFGVSEPVVQTSRARDEQRVIIELAGVHDPQEAIKLIGETPQLDFRREVVSEEAREQFHIDDPEALGGIIFERTQLTGKHLKRARVEFDPVTGIPGVTLEFDGEGTGFFAELTQQNLGKRIAIYLDGVPISAPIVQSEITNGQAVISGGFTLEEAKQLTQRLNAGALPVPIELIGQYIIGPALGRQSLQQSIVAGILGLLAVMVWMITFYRLPGVIASIALLLYALFFLALIKIIPITLTLAGVAGFILTIGMAVDANVLVFERMRENLRSGKHVVFAARDGFRDAWNSIRAGNESSILTAIILYTLGTSLIRGFALTFALGILLSVFTAVTVTRTLLYLVLQARWLHKPFLLAVRRIPNA